MCRNIKTLFNFDPPATDEEIQAAALQFVRKLSGLTKPSKANEEAFERAVAEVTEVADAGRGRRGDYLRAASAAALSSCSCLFDIGGLYAAIPVTA
jgi:hypothetical protein